MPYILYIIIFLLVVTVSTVGHADPSSGAAAGNASLQYAQTNTSTKPKAEEITMQERRSGTWSPELSEDEKKTLFAIAQDTLAWCVSQPKQPFKFDRYTLTPKLKEKTATFVTLNIGNALRGCIGTLTAIEPLYMSIYHNAINAALKDHRFPSVSSEELPKIDIHVSILSPMVKIDSLDEFKLGQQGIVLEKGRGHGAVYLPEVAPEQGWSKEETLSHLSLKAGLPQDAWRKDALFKVFESVVLSMEAGEKR